jgi:hypothetical protein
MVEANDNHRLTTKGFAEIAPRRSPVYAWGTVVGWSWPVVLVGVIVLGFLLRSSPAWIQVA